MNYYTMRASAMKVAHTHINEGKSLEELHLILGVNFGLTPKSIDRMVEVIQSVANE